jgi:hypothetical protein
MKKGSPTLVEALDFAGKDAQMKTLDSLYSYFHNEGYTLQGNTAESDVQWLAQLLYETNPGSRAAWDRLSEGEQGKWVETAKHTLDVLPRLAERMANRYLAIAAAMWSERQVETARKLEELKRRNEAS